MLKFMLLFGFSYLLSVLLTALGSSLAKQVKTDREKMSPFECGFTPVRLPRTPLSLRFFLVAVIFLIFDIELVLVFPAIVMLWLCSALFLNWLVFYVMFILLVGLYYENNQGSLKWAN